MKTLLTILASLVLTLPATAEDKIKIQVHFIQHDANVTITKNDLGTKKLEDRVGKDIESILTAPLLKTSNRQQTELKITDDPPKQLFQGGIMVTVVPVVVGEEVQFTVIGTIRNKQTPQKIKGVKIEEFNTGEFIITGSAKSGKTVIIPFKGIHDLGHGGKTTMLLTLSKVDSE